MDDRPSTVQEGVAVLKDERGVSAVVAIALLVGITVLLSTTVFYLLMSFNTPGDPADVSYEFEREADRLHITHMGGEDVEMCELTVKIVRAGGRGDTVPARQVMGEDEWGGIHFNGENIDECTTMESGDTLTLFNRRVPASVTLIQETENGNEYIVAERVFKYIGPRTKYSDGFMRQENRAGESSFSGPDEEPKLVKDYGVNGQAMIKYPHGLMFSDNESGFYYKRLDSFATKFDLDLSEDENTAGVMPTESMNRIIFYSPPNEKLYVLHRWDQTLNWTMSDVDAQAAEAWENGRGKIIVAHDDNKVSMIDTKNQTKHWTTSLPSDVKMRYPTNTYSEIAILTEDDSIYVLDKDGGAIEWSRSVPGVQHESVTGGFSGPNPVFAVIADGDVVVHHRETGAFEWDSDSPWTATGTPTIMDGSVYVTTKEGHMVKLDSDGSVIWKREDVFGGKPSNAIAMKNRLYVWDQNGSDSGLYSLKKNTGSVVWKKTGLPAADPMPEHPLVRFNGEEIVVNSRVYRDPSPVELGTTE